MRMRSGCANNRSVFFRGWRNEVSMFGAATWSYPDMPPAAAAAKGARSRYQLANSLPGIGRHK